MTDYSGSTPLPIGSGSTIDLALRYFLVFAAAASAVFLIYNAITIDTYNYVNGWVSAHFATIARSFQEHGILALGGVPIQNNAPLTTEPDAYLNWPPLYPLVLSYVFSVFGETEVVHHLFAVSINLAIAGLLGAMLWLRMGIAAAAVAVFVFLNAPSVAKYGHMGLHLHLAILFCIGSIWLFSRAVDPSVDPRKARYYALAGLGVFFASVLTSWEPILAIPGMAIVTLIRRDWRAFRLLFFYGMTGTMAVVAVFGLYWSEYPYFGDSIVNRIMLRMGFPVEYDVSASDAFSSLHFIQETHEPNEGVEPGYLRKATIGALLFQGPIGAVSLVFGRIAMLKDWETPSFTYVISGMLSIYALWAILLPQHNDIHEYQVLLLTPAAALCAGILAKKLVGRYWKDPVFLTFIIAASALVTVYSRIEHTPVFAEVHPVENDTMVKFGTLIREHTPAGSIVASSRRSMVPVYYSQRHMIRSVRDQQTLVDNLSALKNLCSDRPVYLAVHAIDLNEFPELNSFGETVAAGSGHTMIRIR